MKTVVFLFEPAHAAALSYLPVPHPNEKRVFVACGADVEFELEKRGIAFRSARSLRSMPVSERLVFVDTLGAALLTSPAFSFFVHRGIHIGRLFTPALQFYLARVLYFLDIIASALEEDSYDHAIALPPLARRTPTGIALEEFIAQRFLDAVRLACAHRGITLVVPDIGIARAACSFGVERVAFGYALHAANVFVARLVRPKPLRILASEQWKNIAPLMRELPESELVLLDRTESLAAGIAAILRNRIRFWHREDFISPAIKRTAADAARVFAHTWEQVKPTHDALRDAAFRGYPLAPLLSRVLAHVVGEGGTQAVRDIESVYRMYEHARPDIVIVRAGVSAQTHFAVLCQVARALRIPSLEIQHGAFYFGPGSYSRDRAAEYIAEYGPLVRTQLKTVGYDDAHLFDVGSPRFDGYEQILPAQRRAAHEPLHLLCVSPRVAPAFWTDSYDVSTYFEAVAQAARALPGTSVTIKLRPVGTDERFYREAIRRAFAGVPYAVAHYEPMQELFVAADVVVSGYSTALIEALLCGRPTVYFSAGLATYDYHASVGEQKAAIDARSLALARTPAELAAILTRFAAVPGERERLAGAARAFAAKNYSFDGGSAERLAKLIRSLAERRAG